ncbi:hypothetical protein ACOMHN_015795 [Nucella lapillus]
MSKVPINKPLLFVLAFLFIAIPVTVGLLVWFFISGPNGCTEDGSQQMDGGVTATTTPQPTTHTYTPEEIAAKPWLSLRLPSYQTPIHYDITFYPDFYDDHGTFYGNETVEIAISKATKFVLVHIYKLNIVATGVTDKGTGATLEVAQVFQEEENQFLVVEMIEVIEAGSVVELALQFFGSLTGSIIGFYKTQYVNSRTGQTRNMVATKFEPVNARRAFPCMDEPRLKAEYTITLIHRPGYTALSNMPPSKENHLVPGMGAVVQTQFHRSVKMSTYLVCFIVCDFDYLENFTSSGTRVRVYAAPDRLDQTEFALQVGIHSMQQYQRLFNVSYPLPKQDLIAIPDFVSGAMENWGLITFRESALLLDPETASASDKENVATTISHELAHQWFGNLVTMAWWNDLWLNEGFATFMSRIGVDSMKPDWDMMRRFVTTSQYVMYTDAQLSSHPIVLTVDNPVKINQLFDSITYNKVEGSPDVKSIMDTWTLQMGFPTLTLSLTPQASPPTTTTLTATQNRFLADPQAVLDENQSPFKYKWYVSLDCITSAGESTTQIMDLTDVTFQLKVNTDDPSSWVKCNVDQTGYYRVNYPPSNWRRLANMLTTSPVQSWKLSPADRSGLINDAMNLARAGLLGYDVALEMTSYLSWEVSYLPWHAGTDTLTYISSRLMFDADYGVWRAFVLGIESPALERLGWEDTGTHMQKQLRSMLIDFACHHGDSDCLSTATAKFRDWLDKGVVPPVNVRSLVYKWGMWAGGSAEDWDRLWRKYQTEVVPQEKTNLLRALTMTRSPWLMARLLNSTQAGGPIRRQDFATVVRYAARNPVALSQLWNWVRGNWESFVERFTLYDRHFGRIVPYVIRKFNTEFQKQQVLAFFSKYPEAGAGARGRQQALEKIDGNIYWMTHFKPIVMQWLQRPK